MSVAFAYSAHACVGFPQLLWALLRCSEILNWPEVRVKGVSLGKPHPEGICVPCQVTAGMDFWNTAPPDRRHQWSTNNAWLAINIDHSALT